MYTLVKEDGVHDSAVTDRIYHGLGEGVRRLYEYEGEDKEGPEPDEKNAEIERLVKDDGIDPEKNMGQEQRYNSDGSASGVDGAADPSVSPAPEEKEQVDHIVTQEDLDKDPSLSEKGVKVGDTIKVDAEPDTQSDEKPGEAK